MAKREIDVMLNNPAEETTSISSNTNDIPTSNIFSIEKWLIRQVLNALNHTPIFIQLPDGSRISPPGTTPKVGMIVHTRRSLWLFITNPALYFGEEYAKGNIEVAR